MPTATLSPNNDQRINKPKTVTIALSHTDLYRDTKVYISLEEGRGGQTVVFNNTHRNQVVLDGYQALTHDVVIRNFGPENIAISWV